MQAPATPFFRTDLFVPRYRPLQSGAWRLSVTATCLSPGYWSGPTLAVGMAALARDGASWMSTTPLEVESQETGIRAASGHVLIFGLGLGWAAAATACRPAVERVTVVEADSDLLALHRELDVFGQLPEPARSKLSVVEGDAYRYEPDDAVDLLMPDIWLPLISDGRVDEVRRMQANVRARSVYFWGQELEIARHAIAAGRALAADDIAATAAEFGLPLAGLDSPDYPQRLGAAARRWIRGRWLPGSPQPW
ncbi:MAG TPA: hypothetical protein VGX37_07930 [Allosphingosinicella sp.]|jgi:hypothetical protein|nr:hypothetical protein [Allosphingosinicella sp.]